MTTFTVLQSSRAPDGNSTPTPTVLLETTTYEIAYQALLDHKNRLPNRSRFYVVTWWKDKQKAGSEAAEPNTCGVSLVPRDNGSQQEAINLKIQETSASTEHETPAVRDYNCPEGEVCLVNHRHHYSQNFMAPQIRRGISGVLHAMISEDGMGGNGIPVNEQGRPSLPPSFRRWSVGERAYER